MAGAERQRRLDFDAELVGRHARAVVASVHDEAPGRDRHEILERSLDPVPGFDRVERNVLRDLVAGGEADQLADRGLIGRIGEMHDDVPPPAWAFKRRYRGLSLEKAFGQEIDDVLGGLLAADGEAGAVGGRGEGGGHRMVAVIERRGTRRERSYVITP